MLVTCTHCSKTLKVPDTVAGKKVRCPSCSNVVDVPPAAPGTGPAGGSAKPSAGGSRVARPVSNGGEESSSPSRSVRSTPERRTPARRGEQPRRRDEQPPGASGGQRTRGSAARSNVRPTASGRKRPEPVDEYDDGDDAFGYGSMDDGGYESNPFAAPRSRTPASQSRADEAAGKAITGIALLLQGWACVYVFLTMLAAAGVSLLAGPMSQNSFGGGPPRALAMLLGFAMLGNILAVLVIFVGQCLCIAIPARSGAKGWIIASIGCVALMIVLFLTIGFSAQALGLPGRRFTSPASMATNAMVWLWFLAWLAYLICYELFLRQAAIYVGRSDLATQALIILIGVPVTFVGQLVLTIAIGMLAQSLGAVAGIMILVVMLVCLIAFIVFGVMHVALLLRLGSAMRS